MSLPGVSFEIDTAVELIKLSRSTDISDRLFSFIILLAPIVIAVTTSSKTSPRPQIPDLCAEQEELRPRAGCQVPGQPDRVVDPEQDGWRRGQSPSIGTLGGRDSG